MKRSTASAVLVALALAAPLALAANVQFKDPTGDDNGPGKYTYPTDTVYKKGSFDLTGLSVKQAGDKVTFDVSVAANLEDPWRMGNGFAVQMIFIFIQTDPQGQGFTKTLPGLNVQFAEDAKWQKVVILSPQGASRVKSEVGTKVAKDMQQAVIVPDRVRGAGRVISGTVPMAALGQGDPATWSYQVVVQSNEGFPAGSDLLTRKVNEYEGQHRFGGGSDTDCDPHVIDVLAGNGAGEKGEIEQQHQMLAFECGPDGAATKPAMLKMVKKQ